MEDIQNFVNKNQLNKKNKEFLDHLSKTHNCDASIIEKLFRSKIIIIRKDRFEDFFNQIETYLFNIEKQYAMIIEGINEGIIIVEAYRGLEECLEIICEFDIEFIQQGDYLLASRNNEKISEYQKNIVNRNEFSDDILIYAETEEKNLTLTNAFSFLNIEIKTLNPSNEIPQFPIQFIEIPFEKETPESLYIIANQKVKDFFYNHFEVISSVDEWKLIYDLIERVCIYGFFYEFDSKWLIGFKSEDMYDQNEAFQDQVLKWGIKDTGTVKPYANAYYLTVLDDYFMISNFKPKRTDRKSVV